MRNGAEFTSVLQPFVEMIAEMEEERLDEYLRIAQEQGAEEQGEAMTL